MGEALLVRKTSSTVTWIESGNFVDVFIHETIFYSELSLWEPRLTDDQFWIAGVLEANFVEPAHDKQSFERTAVLSRLELRLLQMQKLYWYLLTSSTCLASIGVLRDFLHDVADMNSWQG